MRVLLINSVCGIRSTGRICTDLAQELEAQGHTCKIAYGRVEEVPEPFQKYAVRIGTDRDMRLHGLRTRLLDGHGLGSAGATKRFLAWAEDYDPALVWLHNIHGYYINYELLFAWIKSRPNMEVRWTLHDCWAFTGHCSHFTFAGCEQWKSLCLNCPQTRRYPASFFMSRCKENFERKRAAFCGVPNMTLITPSDWLAGLVRESFLAAYPVQVRHNTIDTAAFKPTESDFRRRHGLENRKIILGVASVWDERKGLKDFYKLAERLDDSYRIVLVGLDEKQRRQLRPNMLGLGRTNSTEELAEIYTAADVLFNPTYEDNYPTVNLEAEACGTAVITYAAGGSPETIRDERSRAVAVGDIEQVLRLI